MSIDGFSMSALAAELDRKLAGGRIDKIFQTDGLELLFWIRQPGENIKLSISANPAHARINITNSSPPNPTTPPAFCMLLRKHLEDGRISSVRQQGRDRVLMIDIDTRGEHGLIATKTLIAEIMGKHSNVILIQDNVITDAVKRIGPAQSRHRQVLPGREYAAPPGQQRLDPFAASTLELMAYWQKIVSGSMAKILIAALDGIGPLSAKEFLYRAGLPADILREHINQEQQLSLAKEIIKISSELKAGHYQPTVISDENSRLLGIAVFQLQHINNGEVRTFSTVSEAVEYADRLNGIRQPPEKQLLTKLLTAEIAKLTRKTTVLREELKEAQNAGEYREKADMLMAYLYQITNGSSETYVPNLYLQETPLVRISLDSNLSPLENANSYYQRYNKLKRAQDSLSKQLEHTEQEILYLESLAVSLDHSHSQEDIGEIRHEIAAAGYLKLSGKKRTPQTLSSPLSYRLTGGFNVQVGKNNRQNDALTMKQAKADDIWLHTKDIPGSHVIIRTEGREPSHDTLLQAAQLAAYYSKARHSANIPVDYTRRRYVRKPSGAKPGFVIYDHHQTIYVTPDESIINSLNQK